MIFEFPRRRVSAWILVCLIAGTPTVFLPAASGETEGTAPAPMPVHLAAMGPARMLPLGLYGASSEPMTEHLIGEPAKVAALQDIAPAVLRPAVRSRISTIGKQGCPIFSRVHEARRM